MGCHGAYIALKFGGKAFNITAAEMSAKPQGLIQYKDGILLV